jgi:uncharacterized membrane protein (UPF0127 family)
MKPSHFLTPLLAKPGPRLALRNQRTGHVLASRLELAADSATRTRGLLGRDTFPADSALILAPCNSIHMFFMRFPIDVIFADRAGKALKVCHALKPWRIAISLRAFVAIELPVGAARAADVATGDRLEVI